MYGRLRRLLAGAFVAGLVLAAAPSAALACNGGVSAVNVYKECLPSGGGGSKPAPHHPKQAGSKHSTTPTQPSGGSGSTTATQTQPPPVSTETKKALAHAGNDKKALSTLIKIGGGRRLLQASQSPTGASEPTAIGSAFDLGSGPTALLIVLVGTVVLLLAVSGTRGLRQRRR